MRASLSLQQSLYRRQQKRIRQWVVGASDAFRRYESGYRRATKGFRRRISMSEVAAQVATSDIVYVGDYHTLKAAQQGYLELLQTAFATGRRVIAAMEFIEGKHQAVLDAFMRSELQPTEFLEQIGHPYRGAFDVWPHFEPIFKFAQSSRIEVAAIDRRSGGSRSLALRDRYAAKRIAELAKATDRPLVVVLMGQFHVTPRHLPAQVSRCLVSSPRRQLVVYQNAEEVYWALAREGRADSTPAVEIRTGELCLISASPVVCQQSFLDYVEAEASDAPLEARGAPAAFRQVAQAIAELIDVDVKPSLKDVQVVSSGSLSAVRWETLRANTGLTQPELKALQEHILSGESAYFPRARLAYLSSLSLNHAAEEAAHFVRHVCIGDAMDRPRPRSEAFFARCLEEALGFFGSRLVNNARHCTQLDAWADTYTHGTLENRRVAAFVLALKASEADEPTAARRLVPADDKLFHSVSHALGYLLGEALFRTFDSARMHPVEIRALFCDPFEHPIERYFALCARLFAPGNQKRRATTTPAPSFAAHG